MARRHAEICPAAPAGISAASPVAQSGSATGQRVWKWQPDGGDITLGTSSLGGLRAIITLPL